MLFDFFSPQLFTYEQIAKLSDEFIILNYLHISSAIHLKSLHKLFVAAGVLLVWC